MPFLYFFLRFLSSCVWGKLPIVVVGSGGSFSASDCATALSVELPLRIVSCGAWIFLSAVFAANVVNLFLSATALLFLSINSLSSGERSPGP